MAQVMDSSAAATTAKARGPFGSLHAFIKENSQVRGRMCQGRQAQAVSKSAQPAAKPIKGDDLGLANSATELKSQARKGTGLKRSLKAVRKFLLSGVEPYPLIMYRHGDFKQGLSEVKACLTSGPRPYPVIL